MKQLVCVADNGSTDGSPEWVAENFKEVKLIRLDKNYGFAGGYNLCYSISLMPDISFC